MTVKKTHMNLGQPSQDSQEITWTHLASYSAMQIVTVMVNKYMTWYRRERQKSSSSVDRGISVEAHEVRSRSRWMA